MIGLQKTNNNPKNRKTSDCVVRAISEALNMKYEDVIEGLVEVWKKTGYCFNDKRNYEKYLESLGWVKCKQPKRFNGKKYLVGEIDELLYPQERALITMAGHMVAKKENHLVDTWDCRRKAISNYYIFPADQREY